MMDIQVPCVTKKRNHTLYCEGNQTRGKITIDVLSLEIVTVHNLLFVISHKPKKLNPFIRVAVFFPCPELDEGPNHP
jgi:hypothetical protein